MERGDVPLHVFLVVIHIVKLIAVEAYQCHSLKLFFFLFRVCRGKGCHCTVSTPLFLSFSYLTRATEPPQVGQLSGQWEPISSYDG